MKKLLAILMTAAMIIGAFTFSVSAEALIGNGAGDGSTNDGTYTDGVESFITGTTEATLTLNINAKQDRYAVDIEFGNLTFDMIGGLVWDVDSHDFVAQSSSSLPSITTTVTLTNHSSLPVFWTVDPNVDTALEDYIEFHCRTISGVSTGEIHAANHTYTGTVGDAQAGTAVVDGVEIYLEEKSADVIDAIAALNQTSITLGTIDVIVKPAP